MILYMEFDQNWPPDFRDILLESADGRHWIITIKCLMMLFMKFDLPTDFRDILLESVDGRCRTIAIKTLGDALHEI